MTSAVAALLFAAALSHIAIAHGSSTYRSGMVCIVGSNPVVHSFPHSLDDLRHLPCDDDVVHGYFNDTIAANGWSFLSLVGNSKFTDEDIASAAGFLEGTLTADRIAQHIANIRGSSTGFPPKMTAFVEENFGWMQAQASQHAASDAYWHHVNLLLLQLRGVYAGFNSTVADAPSWSLFYSMALLGDQDDLCPAFGGCSTPGRSVLKEKGDSHCSVLIKALDRNSDVVIGHNTWTAFGSMLRIYKSYQLPYRIGGTGGNAALLVPSVLMTFSSYPAVPFSLDDFYQTSAGMVITETTISNNNVSLWERLSPDTLLDWARNMVANRLASSGREWMDIYSQHNSGTYNNQWMVLDYKLFTPGEPLRPGFFSVLEQLPGLVVASDMTATLAEQGYWASYNRPFYPEVYSLSNQSGLVREHGDHFTYDKTARAVLLRQLQATVDGNAAYERAIRWNNFQNDAVGTQGCTNGRSGSNAIAERGDLTSPSAGCFDDIDFQNEAAIDAKYTTFSLNQRMATRAISGPTADTQPPFVWSTSPRQINQVPHAGHPDVWNFSWIDVSFG